MRSTEMRNLDYLPHHSPTGRQATTLLAKRGVRYQAGAENIGQLMQDLTVTGGGFGTFTTSTAGPLSSESPVGSAAVSLRGLGTGSTLTLINGRRASVASFAKGQASFIDINSIPTSAIERVEILLSGASASYGADAVAVGFRAAQAHLQPVVAVVEFVAVEPV